MTRRDFALIAAAAILARVGAALILPRFTYLDPAYYELVARQFAQGQGLTVPALWSFLEVGGRIPLEATLPLPSNGHWMPLSALVGALSLWIVGDSVLAARLPMAVVGAGLVVITAWVAWEWWGSRRIALVSSILAIAAGPMLVYVPLPDTFAVFGLAGSLAIIAALRSLRIPSGGRWLVMSAGCVALATLARIDGLLLAVAPLTAWLVRRGIGPWHVPLAPLPFMSLLASAALAGLVLLPWVARQILTFGAPLPSTGGHTIWITSYNEQFSIGHRVDLAAYLAWGVPAIVWSKIESWVLLLGRTAVLLGGVFAIPFLFGLWRERRRGDTAPFLVYWLLLFVVMGGVFTFHAPNGAWYHSAWAWLPFAIPLSVASAAPLMAAIGRRIPLFARPRNQRFLVGAAVAGALVLSVAASATLATQWAAKESRTEAAAAFLGTAARRQDVVMAYDPPSISLATGLRSVPPPFDPFPVIEDVVRAFDVRWVVVERSGGDATDPLNLWSGSAAIDRAGNHASFLGAVPAFESRDGTVRIFEVVSDRG